MVNTARHAPSIPHVPMLSFGGKGKNIMSHLQSALLGKQDEQKASSFASKQQGTPTTIRDEIEVLGRNVAERLRNAGVKIFKEPLKDTSATTASNRKNGTPLKRQPRRVLQRFRSKSDSRFDRQNSGDSAGVVTMTTCSISTTDSFDSWIGDDEDSTDLPPLAEEEEKCVLVTGLELHLPNPTTATPCKCATQPGYIALTLLATQCFLVWLKKQTLACRVQLAAFGMVARTTLQKKTRPFLRGLKHRVCQTLRELASLCCVLAIVARAIMLENEKTRRHRQYLFHLFCTLLERSGFLADCQKGMFQVWRLPVNLCLLYRVHLQMFPREHWHSTMKMSRAERRRRPAIPPMDEASRMMKMATSAYGADMVNLVNAQDNDAPLLSLPERRSFFSTLVHHADHVKEVSREDVLHVHRRERPCCGGDAEDCFSHMLVLDHSRRQAVLTIQGTLSAVDFMVDATHYAVPFCGGYAHSGFVDNAKIIWSLVESMINDSTVVPKHYELIITGHSAGATISTLLTIYALKQDRVRYRRPVRCLAFAPLPCFYPLDKVEDVLHAVTAYTVGSDFATAMCSWNGWQRFNDQVVAVNDARKKSMLTTTQVMKIMVGLELAPKELVEVCAEADKNTRVIRGAPPFQVACSNLVWMNKNVDCGEGSSSRKKADGKYSFVVCDPEKFRQRGCIVTPDVVSDHNPQSYEQAFSSLSTAYLSCDGIFSRTKVSPFFKQPSANPLF